MPILQGGATTIKKNASNQTKYCDLQQLVMLTLMLILNHIEIKYSSKLAHIRCEFEITQMTNAFN